MPRHFGCLGGGGRLCHLALEHRVFPGGAVGGWQLGRRGERRWLVTERRRRELDRILAAESHAESQLGGLPARHGDDPVPVTHPVTGGVPGLIEHRDGHAGCGLARVLVHDPEHPEVAIADSHRGDQYAIRRLRRTTGGPARGR